MLVVLVPRLLMGLLTALGDYSLYKWAGRQEGGGVAAWLLLLGQTNWFLLYSGSRTLVNTMEAALVSVAVSLQPAPAHLPVVALAAMLRPTALLFWAPLTLPRLYTELTRRGPLHLARLCLVPGLVAVAAVTADSLFYGQLTLTPYNFFKVNILHNLGSFYGSNPPYWYLSHALLPILGPLLPLVLLGLATEAGWPLRGPVLASLATLSCLQHKEMRFLQPVLAPLLLLAARRLHSWTRAPPSAPAWLLAAALQLPLALYLAQLHQRGVVDAALWLGRGSGAGSAVYLMPCHSAPMYSHTHAAISLDYLSCLPNLDKRENYVEEVEAFYADPETLFVEKYAHNDCVIIFDVLLETLKKSLNQTGFVETKSFFHTHFPASERVGQNVLVFCKLK